MKKAMWCLIMLSTNTALSGCSGDAGYYASTEQQAISTVSAPFAQGAITVNITAEPGLNAWNDIANSCTLLIIQAQKSSSLDKVLSNPAQVKSLFSGGGSEDEILKVDKYAAMPGEQITLHIDRAQNTRSVAIVAGYYPFPDKQHVVVLNIPVKVTSTGWWVKKWAAQMSPLVMHITLGSQSITRLKEVPPQTKLQSQRQYDTEREHTQVPLRAGDKINVS